MKFVALTSLFLASAAPVAWPAGESGLMQAPQANTPATAPAIQARAEAPLDLVEARSGVTAGAARTFAFRSSGRAVIRTADDRMIVVHTVSHFYLG